MEAGSNRTAKASNIEKHNTEKSKQTRNKALKLRGKSEKYFKIELFVKIFFGSIN